MKKKAIVDKQNLKGDSKVFFSLVRPDKRRKNILYYRESLNSKNFWKQIQCKKALKSLLCFQ